MTIPTTPDAQGSSTRPYLIRALHEWCVDNGFTPYVAVFVDASVQVPVEYVKNNEIVLNVGFEATSGMKLGNEFIEFRARFGGVARDIVVPIDHVVAIYARENGQGMAFPVPVAGAGAGAGSNAGAAVVAVDRASTAGKADGRPTVLVAAPAIRLAHTEAASDEVVAPSATAPDDDPSSPPPSPPSARPSLKRVK